MPATASELLKQVTRLWLVQIELARKDKDEKFGTTAKRLEYYYGKRYRQEQMIVDRISDKDFPHVVPASYKPVINKSRQFVELYLPAVHASLTHRLVRPRRPELPPALAGLGMERPDVKQTETIRSWLMEWILNYIPTEYEAFNEQRRALQDALVKGRGLLWTETFDGPYGEMVGSFHDNVDYLLIDPDTVRFRDAGYIVRERWEPAYRLAEDWKIDVGKFRARGSTNQHAASEMANGEDRDEYGRRKGDLVKVYEIFSRIGIGHRLVSAGDDANLQAFGAALDEIGRHVHLLICDGIEHPLNLKPDEVDAYEEGPEVGEFLRAQLEWPIKFFEEHSNPWPVTCIDPYPNVMDAWATSPLEAGLPIQEYLDQAYSWIMKRLKKTCRDIVVTSEALEAQIDDALEGGLDLELLKYKGKPGEDLDKHWAIISFPEMKAEVWRAIAILNQEYERITGMTPLMSGMQDPNVGKDRSAAESEIRESHTQSRPQDIARSFQDAMSRLAAKEGQAVRLTIAPETVAPLFSEPTPELGEDGMPQYEGWVPGPLTIKWMELVATDDPRLAAAECHYTVEAGSGVRKNKQWIQSAAQNIIPLVMDLAKAEYQVGDPRKWNAIMQWVSEGWEVPMNAMMQPEGPELQQMMAMIQAAQGAQPPGGEIPTEGGPPNGLPGM